ncbi:MAG: AMP-binding protein [Methylococcaceae bacterium]
MPLAIVNAQKSHSAPSSLILSELLAHRVANNKQGRIWEFDALHGHRSFTVTELWMRSENILTNLACQGVLPGNTVLLIIDDVLNFVPAIWACLRGGFLVVPINSSAEQFLRVPQDHSLLAILKLLTPELIIIYDTYFNSVAAHIKGLRPKAQCILVSELISFNSAERMAFTGMPDDPIILIPTSGTTGEPTLVTLTNQIVSHRTTYLAGNHSPDTTTCLLSWFPLDSITGLNIIYFFATTIVYLPKKTFLGQPELLLDAIEQFQVTYTLLSNFTARLVCQSLEDSKKKNNLSSLHSIGFGAEMITPKVIEKLSRLLHLYKAPIDCLKIGYGMSETSLICSDQLTFQPDLNNHLDYLSVGHCVADVSLRIVDDNDKTLLTGQQGHIQVHSPYKLFSGYYGLPALTLASFTEDGWFKTGDLGYLDNNKLTITGRNKDIIIVNAKKYALLDIESSVLQLRDIHEALAIVSTESDTEELLIFFVPVNLSAPLLQATIQNIRRTIAQQFGLAVKQISPVDAHEIPRTATGKKIRRIKLVQHLLQYQPKETSVPRSNTTPILSTHPINLPNQLTQIWQEILDLSSSPQSEDNFFDFGGDSFRLAQLRSRVEATTGRTMSFVNFLLNPTLSGLNKSLTSNSEPSLVELSNEQPNQFVWQLPNDLFQKQLSYISAWQGERHKQNQFIFGLNINGSLPPLFWVFQGNQELAELARQLGPDQPLYGMRSGHLIMQYHENNVQALALCYQEEIIHIAQEGPLLIGGNCQGGIIAQAIAQHLLRRRRHVPLLILMEWAFPLHTYAEPVLLLFGKESRFANPYFRYQHPEKAWQRAFPHYEIDYIPGNHGDFFSSTNCIALAKILKEKLAKALTFSPRMLPEVAYQIELQILSIASPMIANQQKTLHIRVKNSSPVFWSPWKNSGIVLSNYWLNNQEEVINSMDGSTHLPSLNPGTAVELELTVNAPELPGQYLLQIDLIEEGNITFSNKGCIKPSVPVQVIAANNPQQKIQSRLFAFLKKCI